MWTAGAMAYLAGLHNLCKLTLVLVLNSCDCAASGGLLVHKLTKASLALDNAEGDTLLLAESGKPHNKLNRVHIVCDDHKLCLS